MANAFKTTSLVARGIVDQFKYDAPFTATIKSVNKFIGASFDGQTAKSGRSIDVKLPNRAVATGGTADSSYDGQDIYEEYTPFSLTSFRKAHFPVTLEDEADLLDSVMEDVLDPSKMAIVDKKEAEHSEIILGVGNAILADSTGADIDDASKVRSRLRELGTPSKDIIFLTGSDIMDNIVDNTSNFFNPSKEISGAWYTGEIRSAKDMKWITSELLPILETGTAYTSAFDSTTGLTVLGTVATSGTVTALADGSSVAISGVANDGTVTKGTIIEISGVEAVNSTTYDSLGWVKQFAVAEDATVTGGAVTLSLTDKMNDGSVDASKSVKNISALPAAGATVSIVGEVSSRYKQAVAYHKDAFFVGFSGFAKPKGNAEFDKFEGYNGKTGIKGQCVYVYDFNSNSNIYRTDSYSGVALGRREFACRLLQKIV